MIGANCCGDVRALQTSYNVQSHLYFLAAAPIMCGSSEWRPCHVRGQSVRKEEERACVDAIGGVCRGNFCDNCNALVRGSYYCCFVDRDSVARARWRPVVAAERLAACAALAR